MKELDSITKRAQVVNDLYNDSIDALRQERDEIIQNNLEEIKSEILAYAGELIEKSNNDQLNNLHATLESCVMAVRGGRDR